VFTAEAFRIKNAAHIWFVHNHPSGLARLSTADTQITRALQTAFDGTSITAHGILGVTSKVTTVTKTPKQNTWTRAIQAPPPKPR
jgi:DNA repair protein RadC